MFSYAKILREEIEELAKIGFSYVQLSDPALVYKPSATSISKGELATIGEAVGVAVKGLSVKTCLQTFFGDFSQILPEALEFPLDHLGIDLYETNLKRLKEYRFEKGIALGLVDARNSLVEDGNWLVKVVKEVIELTSHSQAKDLFICPNCDLEFLPWEIAERKIVVASFAAKRLRERLYE